MEPRRSVSSGCREGPFVKLARLSLYVMAVVFLGLGAMSLVAPTKLISRR